MSKMKQILKEWRDYTLLNESSLSRVYRHIQEHDCVIITAFRDDTEDETNCTERSVSGGDNKERNRDLKATLLGLGYGVTAVDGSYVEQFITDYVEDLIFIPKDENGVAIEPPPTNESSNINQLRVFDIRAVEIGLTTRSSKKFYNNVLKADGNKRTIFDMESDTEEDIDDLFLRETVVMSVNTRNIGLE